MDYIRWLRDRVGHSQIILNFAGCAVLDADGKVLLQRRGDRERDVWGFPGGAVELGESVAEAAVREVAEETGLIVEVRELLGIYSKYRDAYPNGDSAQPITTFFIAEPIAGDLRGDGRESIALDFFGGDDLPTLLNAQHADAASDLFAGRRGVWR